MKVGELVKNAPNALIYTVGFVLAAILAAFTVLSISGSDATELRAFINTLLNIAAAVFSGGAVVVAGSAAKSAGNTEKQTNGVATEERAEIARQAASQAISDYRAGNVTVRPDEWTG